MIPKATIKTFIRRARELGALEAKLIEASSIVTAPWVRLKCRYGCNGYNGTLVGPRRRSEGGDPESIIPTFRIGKQ